MTYFFPSTSFGFTPKQPEHIVTRTNRQAVGKRSLERDINLNIGVVEIPVLCGNGSVGC